MKPWQWLATSQRVHWPRVLLLALTGGVLVTVLILGLTSTAAFGLYNPSWDGASDLRDHLESADDTDVELLTDTAQYDDLDANESTVFLIAPEEQYTAEQSSAVRDYVDRGGTLIVLDNFANNTNPLLSDIDAEARLDGRIVRDELNYYQAPTMPVTTTIANHSLTTGIDELTFNYVTAIEPGTATVLIWTSEFGYLTESPTEELAANATLGEYPVATVEPLGDGSLVLVGDPSLTINAMLAKSDNRAFIDGLYSGSQVTVIDISTHEPIPPLQIALTTIQDSQAIQLIIGTLGILALALIRRHRDNAWLREALSTGLNPLSSDKPSTEQVGMTPADKHAYLSEHVADLDETQRERIIAAFNKRGEKVHTNNHVSSQTNEEE